MPFQEKSAWVMSFALLLGGIFYFGLVTAMSADIGRLAHPVLPAVAIYTVILIALAVLGHIAIAALAPKEAVAPLDERERRIVERASHISGYIFGVGVIMSLGIYLLVHNGDILFYGIFPSLMISQLAEYAIQILLFRTSV